MAPKKKAARPRASAAPSVGGGDQNLLLMIGEMRGALHAHIDAVDQDREEAAVERGMSASYRKEVRDQLADLKREVHDQLADFKSSLAATETLKKRVDRIEPIVDANARQIFLASSIIAGAFVLIGSAIKMFGADIKSFVLRLFKVS